MSERILATAACHTDRGRVRAINEDASLIFDLDLDAVVDRLTNFPLDQAGERESLLGGMIPKIPLGHSMSDLNLNK